MAAERPSSPQRRRRLSARRAGQGFGLIEVLMALLLFSVGVLGMVALQARASQFSTQAEDRSRAMVLANDLVATMWAQGTTSLDSTIFDAWNARVGDATADGLPDGKGEVSGADADGVVTVTITWTAIGLNEAEKDKTYETKVVMP